jgi:hypothetical protein
MLTTINKGMSASEHAIEITAVETRPCARGRVRDDRRQVDVKGQEYETDCTRDKHTSELQSLGRYLWISYAVFCL